VITPSPSDLEVARRVALSPEAESPDQAKRRVIAGLDVGFKAMKAEPAKGIVDHE